MTFGGGFEILGLLIYTYEPNDEMENSALNSPNLRGKIPAEKRRVRYAVERSVARDRVDPSSAVTASESGIDASLPYG